MNEENKQPPVATPAEPTPHVFRCPKCRSAMSAFLNALRTYACRSQTMGYGDDAPLVYRSEACTMLCQLQKEKQALLDAVRSLTDVGKELLLQNNLATEIPLFIVQQRVRDYGIDHGYTDDMVWLNKDYDYREADAEEAQRLESGEDPDDEWEKIGYRDRWEFVTACLTRKGCEDYISANGHNLTDPRIYVETGHRNREWQELREVLMRLAGAGQEATTLERSHD